MDLTITKSWVESPDYHSLSAAAKLALWEVMALVSPTKPVAAKELAFKLRLPQPSLEGALEELAEAGFATEQEGAWFCQFKHQGKAVVRGGGNKERQARFQAKLRAEKKAAVLSGEGPELADGESVPVASKTPREQVDYQAVLDLFRKHCPKMTQPLKLDSKRQRLIKGRWFDFKKQLPDASPQDLLELFGQFFEQAGASSYLNGECNRPGSLHANWKADLNFLLRQDQFEKVIAGAYTNR